MVFTKRVTTGASFQDDFSSGLANWTAHTNGGSFQTQSGALVGHSSRSCSSATCPHADLILNDNLQVTGDLEASVQFGPIADLEDPSLVANGVAFSLWRDANHKIQIGATVTDGGVRFLAQYWDGQWHTISESTRRLEQVRNLLLDSKESHDATLVRTGSRYRFHIGGMFVGEVDDVYLNGDSKVGLHVHGTRKMANFKIRSGGGPAGGLWAVEAEMDGKPGRGFQFEVRNNVLVGTVYAYDGAGNPTFYLSSGPIKDNTFAGDLNQYVGGMSFGAPARSAVMTGSAGRMSLRFSDSGHGTIQFPGEVAKPIVKFNWAPAINVQPTDPVSGLWVVDVENNGQPGRGFQIEVQNQWLVLTVFGYNEAGQGTFYFGSGSYSGNRMSAQLEQFRDGMSFGGARKSAVSAGTAGQVVLEFSDATHGTITFPGESPKKITKFLW